LDLSNEEIYTPSSLIGRFFANFVDLFLCAVLFVTFSFVLDQIISIKNDRSTNAFIRDFTVVFSLFVLPVGYFSILEASSLQATLGKRLLGMKVIDGNSSGRITFSKSLGRSLIKISSFYLCGPLTIVHVWVFSNDQKQAIHDAFVNTLVVDS
jgi:uncharacterized RDD family membrane protein YckC